MTDLINYLSGIVSGFYTYFVNFALWILQKAWSFIVDIATYLISLIPDSGLSNMVSSMQWLSTSLSSAGVFQWLSWLYGLIQFDFAIKLILGALVARFILRRIPFLG